MYKIALPNKISFQKSDDPNRGQVVVEPCYPGFGVTIGNALRRVLLSSLAGAAVVGVKIEGVDHEFMAIPHIKEDILQILLNLKKMQVKIKGDVDEVKLELKAHGKKKVKASDIEKNADVEISSKDLEIANITDMAGNLNMEIYVKRGLGYESIDSREGRKTDVGYIEIDSIFTPVLNVTFDIESARVGKMTNWDKLILDITTDGTITPMEAFESSASILIEQFSSLQGKEAKESVDDKKEKKEEAESAEEFKEEGVEESKEENKE